MSDLPEMLKKLKYDKRMLNWNLRQRLLTEEEYQKHLDGLEDLSHLQFEQPPESESDSAKTPDSSEDQQHS